MTHQKWYTDHKVNHSKKCALPHILYFVDVCSLKPNQNTILHHCLFAYCQYTVIKSNISKFNQILLALIAEPSSGADNTKINK